MENNWGNTFLCKIYSFLLPDLQYHRESKGNKTHNSNISRKWKNEKMKLVGKLYGRKKKKMKIKKNCLWRRERSFHRNFIWSGGLCATLFTDMQTMFGNIYIFVAFSMNLFPCLTHSLTVLLLMFLLIIIMVFLTCNVSEYILRCQMPDNGNTI